jgi:hypothetical protein
MFQKLVSRNPDLARLVERGYAVAFDSLHLVVRDIPYLNAAGDLEIGAIVTQMSFPEPDLVQQNDHQIFFCGGVPHGLDGVPIPNLAGGPVTIPLSPRCDDIPVQRSFSNKPKPAGKFDDFFAKIESYVAIISGPAMEKFPVTPLTFRVDQADQPESVFKFHDTLTSRAEIADLTDRLKNDVVAIIGLGGTGAYILDYLVKTPVREIRGFDGDEFHVHTAFRAPGRLYPAEFRQPKATVYQARYENFRSGLSLAPRYVVATSAADLQDVTFAFVCVDRGPARKEIFDLLISMDISFIDVGMGLNKKPGGLGGLLRMTYFEAGDAQRVRDLALAEEGEGDDNLYKANIQISELNALNAALAVVRFKQARGFYTTSTSAYHALFDVTTGTIGTQERDEV